MYQDGYMVSDSGNGDVDILNFQNEFEGFLNSVQIPYQVHTQSLNLPDFEIHQPRGDEQLIGSYWLELKEKRTYNVKNWPQWAGAERDLFILDCLSVKKSLYLDCTSFGAGILVRAPGSSQSYLFRYYFASSLDLMFMPKIQVVRRLESGAGKAKFLLDLNHFHSAQTIEEIYSGPAHKYFEERDSQWDSCGFHELPYLPEVESGRVRDSSYRDGDLNLFSS